MRVGLLKRGADGSHGVPPDLEHKVCFRRPLWDEPAFLRRPGLRWSDGVVWRERDGAAVLVHAGIDDGAEDGTGEDGTGRDAALQLHGEYPDIIPWRACRVRSEPLIGPDSHDSHLILAEGLLDHTLYIPRNERARGLSPGHAPGE